MQSWVEIPEKYDEMWSRRATSARLNNAAKIRPPALDWRAGLENLRRRRTEREAAETLAKADKTPNDDKTPNEECIEQNTDHIVDINDKTPNENGGVIAKSVRNVYLINRVLAGLRPSEKEEIGDENADEQETDLNRKSVYDNVDLNNKLEVSGPTTGDESSYKSGEDFRDTTETGGGGNPGSSDAPNSDNNNTDNKNEKQAVPLEKIKELKDSDRKEKTKPNDGNIKESRWKKSVPSIILRKPTKPKITVSKADPDEVPLEEIKHNINDNDTNKNNEEQTTKPFSNVVRLAQQVNKFTNNSQKVQNRRKFNYEKYIKYLELTLGTVGFLSLIHI